MEHLPPYIPIAFTLSTLLCLWLLFRAANRSRILLRLSAAWLLLQAVIAGSGFYAHTATLPPRLALAVLPPMALIAFLFCTAKGRGFADSLSLQRLSLVHLVRIPVEGVLLALFLHKAVPGGMTFGGYNFDIVSGITAPLAFYWAGSAGKRKWLLAWNFLCLGLLLNIVIYAIFAAPFPFQQWDFEQPNEAVLHFPFIWLPSFVVPVVLFAHLSAIRQLWIGRKGQPNKAQAITSRRQPIQESLVRSC